jgi:hypothetical protein
MMQGDLVGAMVSYPEWFNGAKTIVVGEVIAASVDLEGSIRVYFVLKNGFICTKRLDEVTLVQ